MYIWQVNKQVSDIERNKPFCIQFDFDDLYMAAFNHKVTRIE